MSQKLVVWGMVLLGGAAAIAGASGLVINAQGAARPLFVALLLSLPAYFLIYNRLYPYLKDSAAEASPVLATREARGRIWVAAFIASLLLCEGMVYATRSEIHHVESSVQEQLLKRNKFGHPEAWRLIITDSLYVYVPFSAGEQDYVGMPIEVDYRDSWLGVRFIERQRIGTSQNGRQG